MGVADSGKGEDRRGKESGRGLGFGNSREEKGGNFFTELNKRRELGKDHEGGSLESVVFNKCVFKGERERKKRRGGKRFKAKITW